ncbi:hypothetical protein SAMN04488571_107102 [Methanoculleus thermophilus]|jgi:hypothetical protein|uniref:Uncharacterized protein n=1 Tax=Methanoculleus thermophilus TaxID=2200 RepID=A0A1G9AZ42_9EURY|nr:hypothetical protein SAMN04488571_107102 [Methanoculleus thermophilus]
MIEDHLETYDSTLVQNCTSVQNCVTVHCTFTQNAFSFS